MVGHVGGALPLEHGENAVVVEVLVDQEQRKSEYNYKNHKLNELINTIFIPKKPPLRLFVELNNLSLSAIITYVDFFYFHPLQIWKGV